MKNKIFKIRMICNELEEGGGESYWICPYCNFSNENWATNICGRCGKE